MRARSGGPSKGRREEKIGDKPEKRVLLLIMVQKKCRL